MQAMPGCVVLLYGWNITGEIPFVYGSESKITRGKRDETENTIPAAGEPNQIR